MKKGLVGEWRKILKQEAVIRRETKLKERK